MKDENFFDQQSQFPDIDGVWNFDDLLVTESTIQNLLPKQEVGELWNLRAIELLTQLGRVEALQGKLTQAKATLIKAEQLISRLDKKERLRAEIRYLLEQGRLYYMSKTPIQAEACFHRAWFLSEENGEIFFSIDAALMLALTQTQKAQKEWFEKALNLAETSTNEQVRLWLSQLYIIAGWNSFELRRFDEALGHFKRALEKLQVEGTKSKILAAKWCMGRALRALNRVDEALATQQELLSELSLSGKVDGHVFLELAECYQILKNPIEAKKNFELAYKELSLVKWYADNKSFELSRIQHLAKTK